MDSGALLDLLGNENRRRILRLLSQKPCYVTEISDYLGVSPKAVIDHLRKLESAGIVESRTDKHRRKYFYISRDVRLEVNVSRYGYGAKSAYPASATLDLTTCRHLSVNVDGEHSTIERNGIDSLAADLRRLEELSSELSLAQRYVQGQLIDVIDSIVSEIETDASDLLNGRLFFDVLVAIAEGHQTVEGINDQIDIPMAVLENALERFREHGVLEFDGTHWRLAGPTGAESGV